MNWSLDSIQTNLLRFECFQEVFYRSWIRFANDPYRLYHWLHTSRLAQFRKTWKHANQGKTQWWALFVVFQASQHFDFKLKDWMTSWLYMYMLDPGKIIINSNAKAHRERFVLDGFDNPSPPPTHPPRNMGFKGPIKGCVFKITASDFASCINLFAIVWHQDRRVMTTSSVELPMFGSIICIHWILHHTWILYHCPYFLGDHSLLVR